MNLELHRFLNDSRSTFAESEPRPPVPGEENESESNGKVSSRSSESRKSHSSSGKSFSPGHGSSASPKVDKSNPLPRKSSSEIINCGKGCEESAAPLGFEPEGEVSNIAPFTEVSAPSCLRWASNVESLLEDGEGVKLFKQFLDQEHNSNCLEFWFACEGLKLIPATDEIRIQSLVKLIYKKYIKGNQLAFKSEIKKNIAEKLKSGSEAIEQHIFNDAQREVELILKTDAYPQFLKSDTYLQYLQSADSESPRVSDGSSGCASARPLSAGLLPTLHEDEELQHEDLRRDSPSSPLSLTPVNLAVTLQQRALRSVASDGCFLRPRSSKPYHAYHTSYAPTSAQDSASELQSLSSDAQTDETLSQTDGSIDGRDSKKWKKRAMRKNAHLNRQSGPHHQLLIPRQDRVSRDGNVAETNPDKFSCMLIEKLLRVKEDHDKLERVRDTMKAMEAAEDHMAVRGSDVPPAGANLPLQALLSFSERERGDENPQSILDDHLSRVWDSSDHHTPLRSPGGQQSPQLWPGGRKPLPSLPAMTGGQGVAAKRRDVSSSLPANYASKMVAAGAYPGVKDMRQRRPPDCEPGHVTHVPPTGGYVTLWNDTPQAPVHRRSHGDSGVDTTPGSSGIGQEPLVDKVLQWMMRSDISPAAGASGDASFAQKRPQHKPSVSPQQHRSHRKAQPVRGELGERQATVNGQSAFSVPWQPRLEHADATGPVIKSRSVTTGLSDRQAVSASKLPGDDSMVMPASRSHNTSSVTSPGSDVTVVGYYFCGEPIPYRTTVNGLDPMTLAQFKALIMKKGNYRYFFKTVSDEFDSGIVHEEVKDDDAVLPFFDGKIICRVEKADQS